MNYLNPNCLDFDCLNIGGQMSWAVNIWIVNSWIKLDKKVKYYEKMLSNFFDWKKPGYEQGPIDIGTEKRLWSDIFSYQLDTEKRITIR